MDFNYFLVNFTKANTQRNLRGIAVIGKLIHFQTKKQAMGTARSNLLNQLKGSFGNVILYEVNGQLRIRSKTGRYRKSKSSKQI